MEGDEGAGSDKVDERKPKESVLPRMVLQVEDVEIHCYPSEAESEQVQIGSGIDICHGDRATQATRDYSAE